MGTRRPVIFWLGIALAVIVGVPALAALVGVFLPRDHVARMSVDLIAPPERVWALVSDFEGAARWRAGVTRVQMRPAEGAPLRFVETSKQGTITFEVVIQEPPRRQVVRVVDDDQPFGGTWTWHIEPDGAGTRLTLVEAGFIKNPLFRVMGALFFPPTATIDAYLRALAKELGESSTPHAPR